MELCEGGEGGCCRTWHRVPDSDEKGHEVVDEFFVWGKGERGEEGVGEGLEEAGLVEDVC